MKRRLILDRYKEKPPAPETPPLSPVERLRAEFLRLTAQGFSLYKHDKVPVGRIAADGELRLGFINPRTHKELIDHFYPKVKVVTAPTPMEQMAYGIAENMELNNIRWSPPSITFNIEGPGMSQEESRRIARNIQESMREGADRAMQRAFRQGDTSTLRNVVGRIRVPMTITHVEMRERAEMRRVETDIYATRRSTDAVTTTIHHFADVTLLFPSNGQVLRIMGLLSNGGPTRVIYERQSANQVGNTFFVREIEHSVNRSLGIETLTLHDLQLASWNNRVPQFVAEVINA